MLRARRVCGSRRFSSSRCLGVRLEADYSAQAPEIAVQLAVHFERAVDTVQAVHYWQQMGENAARHNAHDQGV
jgi:hypothetical protein